MSLKPISTGNDPGLPLFSFYITVVFDPVVFSSIRKMEIFFFRIVFPLFLAVFPFFFIFARYFLLSYNYSSSRDIFVKFSRLFSFNKKKTFRFVLLFLFESN